MSPGKSGVPDRIISVPKHRIFFVEVKAPGKKVTPTQLRDHLRRKELGFPVFIMDQKPMVDKFIRLIEMEVI